ncbi:sulfite exporter TauE/SafE family protein [Longirhabdus pacifica]|uniref:sulfite exporter TauE/SafE family protein n=1 Tax=Longirhabdus pacifica TaxID=2305227 RepID=UPI0010086D79|nr:sulfite exporter TauE/SafE family protein [Longirhabdus pacifica]
MGVGIAVLGLLVGFLVGITGVGGAALLTPALLIIGISPTIAVGTDLFYNAVTKFFGTVQHLRQKTIDFKIVFYLALGSIPGAVSAVLALQLFDTFFVHQEQIIRQALGVILIIVAASTIIRLFYSNKENNKNSNEHISNAYNKKIFSIITGFILGAVVGLTSVGSGSLFALLLIYFYRMSGVKVVGTDIAHAFLLVTVASVLHAGYGHVDYQLAANLLIGSIPGVLLGSTLATKVPSRPLRIVVSIFILLSGIKLVT